MQAIFETTFDVVYLLMVTYLGVRMILGSRKMSSDRTSKQFLLYGIMAVVLGLGDAFHLVPRMVALLTTGLASYVVALGVGKLITSITMTLFYVLLYYVWRRRYNVSGRRELTIVVWVLALSRIILTLLPQNDWFSMTPPLDWGIYRNIPFTLLGLLVLILCYKAAKQYKDGDFRYLWLTILLSFGFYLPVVLLAHIWPVIGMLMIPKTCAYIWTVLIGYHTMRRELTHEWVVSC